MAVEIATIFADTPVIMNGYPDSDLVINVVTDRVNLTKMDELMDAGWVIMCSWIEEPDVRAPVGVFVNDVMFRLGKGNERVVLKTDVPLPVPMETIPNIDADEPGSVPDIVNAMTTATSKLRAASISGYGPYASRGPGLKRPLKPPKLSIVGLDIEVSTAERSPGMPLPEDEIMTIAITNGGWYDKEFEDKCVCAYTFGSCSEVAWDNGRTGVTKRVRGSVEAVRFAYETIVALSPDFVNIHNGFNFDLVALAAWAAFDPEIEETFVERRLGNVGTGIDWQLPNGSVIVDSMYGSDKNPRTRKVLKSLSLRALAEKWDLPPKLDVDAMDIDTSKAYDHATMIKYNARDADLHAWVCKKTLMCERMCAKMGVARATMQDAVADNTGVMGFCMIQSVAISGGTIVDLSRNSTATDDRKIEGGHVVTPIPGCYKGVIVIDANSLYPSLMRHLGLFIDRCTSATSTVYLKKKMKMDLPAGTDVLAIGDMVSDEHAIVMRTMHNYIGVIKGAPTMLSGIIDELVSMRRHARKEGDEIAAEGIKVLSNSIYGSMASRHGIMSSKTCAEATTCAARLYLRKMIGVAEAQGSRVIYGDTDSIMVHVGGATENECMNKAVEIKAAVETSMKGTAFEKIKIDVEGNFETFVITAKKKYAGMKWDAAMVTKGMAPVKKDVVPVAKTAASKVLSIIMSNHTYEEKKLNLIMYLGGLAVALERNLLPVEMQVAEKRINCQPHYAYTKTNGEKDTALVDMGLRASDVSKKWIMERITGSIKTILEASGMPGVPALIFSYNMIMRTRRDARRPA
jgi:DNA polymerase elongation subunit (family B)